eukprot:scaffold20126_cov13-Tisochrysis_lutea.AAC.1
MCRGGCSSAAWLPGCLPFVTEPHFDRQKQSLLALILTIVIWKWGNLMKFEEKTDAAVLLGVIPFFSNLKCVCTAGTLLAVQQIILQDD